MAGLSTVQKEGKTRRISAEHLPAFIKNGWNPGGNPAPKPIEAKAVKPKKEKPAENVDSEE